MARLCSWLPTGPPPPRPGRWPKGSPACLGWPSVPSPAFGTVHRAGPAGAFWASCWCFRGWGRPPAGVQPSGPLSQSHLCVVPHTAGPKALLCRCLCPRWPEGRHQVQGHSGEASAASRPQRGRAPPEHRLPGAWPALPIKRAQGPAQTCGCSRLVLAGGSAPSPGTCMRGQQPQDPPSPRCHLDMGTPSLGPNTAHTPSTQHPENVFGWKSLQIRSVSLKLTKLPAFLSSLRGMQAKESRPPFPISNRKAMERSAQAGFCMQGGRRQAVPWAPGPSARGAPAHRPPVSHCPHDPPHEQHEGGRRWPQGAETQGNTSHRVYCWNSQSQVVPLGHADNSQH